MNGGAIVREARKRRGLSQTELARRLGTTQSAVARLESGRSNPRFDTVVEAVRACGFDLHFNLAEFDAEHRRLIDDALAVSPTRRLSDLLDRLQAEKVLHQARRVS
jgi:transcriptional regulator with XRE-family HTH domain